MRGAFVRVGVALCRYERYDNTDRAVVRGRSAHEGHLCGSGTWPSGTSLNV